MKNELTVKEEKGLAIQSFEELEARAKFLANSSLLPNTLRGKPADVAVILMQGVELGIGPMQALSGINVIQGKPSISPELQIAMIRSRCPEAYIKIESLPGPVVKVTMAPSRDRMDEAFTTTWDMDRARRMNLAGKDNYKSQPETMLKWRAIGEAARTVFPHVTKGLKNTVEAVYDEGEDSGNDKAGELAAKLGLVKPEEKEVVAEVVAPKEPEVVIPEPPKEPEVVVPSVGDKIIPFGNPGVKGKAIKDLDRVALEHFVKNVHEMAKANGKPIVGVVAETLSAIQEYLNSEQDDLSLFDSFSG